MDPRIIEATLRIADQFRVPPHHALAFVEVESNGDAFDPVAGQDMPLIRWEGHYFDRRLRKFPSALTEARAQGLADPKAGGVKNPRNQEGRYAILDRAVALCERFGVDTDIPYECVSIGLGQVMGSHWEDLGYDSAKGMLDEAHDETFDEDVEDQIEMIFLYLRKNDLLNEVVRGDWAAAARGYNGPAYAKNRYDERLEEAAGRWQRRLQSGATDAPTYPTLRMGRGPSWAVEALQSKLSELDYPVGAVDGSFGRLTRDAVLAFQADHNLATDGVAGTRTWEALETAPVKRPVIDARANATADDLRRKGSKTVDLGDKLRVAGTVIGGGGAVSLSVSDAEESVETASRWVQVAREGKSLLDAHWEIAFLAMGAVVVWLGWQVVSNRLKDHRSGANTGR